MSARERSDSPLWKPPVEEEVREELDFHVEMRVRQYMDEGLPEAEAREKALARLGDRKSLSTACARLAHERNRKEGLKNWFAEARIDVGYAFRQMKRNPWFALTVMGILALGLGANLAVFTIVDEVLLRPLSFEDPSRLATVWEQHTVRGKKKNVANPANFLLFRDTSQTMDSMSAFVTIDATLTGDGAPPVRARARLVTDGYFSVLGVSPVLGRVFDSKDYQDTRRSIVLSHRLWQTRFGGRRDIVSQTLSVDGKQSHVLGVMPPGFGLGMGADLSPYGDAPDFYWPLPEDNWETQRGRWLMIVARLAEGASMSEAHAEMELLSERMMEMRPDYNANWGAHLVPLETHLNDGARAPLTALAVAVGLILLIACVNVASLLSARAASRQGEMSIRNALGAGRARIVRQLFTESLITATLALGLGIGLAMLALPALRAALPPALTMDVDGLASAFLNGRLLVVATGLLALCSISFGVLPGFLATRRVGAARRDGFGTPEQNRFRSVLVFAEVVLAVILLVGSGLLIRSFWRLIDVHPGFEGDGVVTFGVSPSRDLSEQQLFSFYDRLIDELDALPGVEQVGAVSHVPIASVGAATSYFPTDRAEPPAGEAPSADIRVIRGDYLQTMRIPILEGRDFGVEDREGHAMGSVMVSQQLAEKHWPDDSAVGQRLDVSWGDGGERMVVGVVSDVRHAGRRSEARDAIYFPHQQERERGMRLVLRGGGNLEQLFEAARSVVSELDADLPIYDVQTMDGILGDSIQEDRALTSLVGLLAGVALLLAGFGIYGMTAYSVAEREREFGLRMAMGASPSSIGGLVLRQVAILGAAALGVGVVASFFGGRMLESLLYEVNSSDIATYAGVAILLAAGCLVAALVPALRASRLAPMVALRQQ